MDFYREEILEHWRNPQNFGVMDKPDAVIEQVNPLCGDEVTFYFKFAPSLSFPRKRESRTGFSIKSRMTKKNQGNTRGVGFDSPGVSTVIKDVRFTGSGCAISIASASMLSEAIKGKSVAKIGKITGQDVLGLIGGNVAPARLKCAFLSLEAVKKLRIS